MKGIRLTAFFVALTLMAGSLLSGCVLTKVATVPMRVGGAVISVVPVIGNPVDGAIDSTADVIDKIPL